MRLSDEELIAWLRAGCGPIEATPEHSDLAKVDPALGAKLPSAVDAFPGVKGTIVHARDGELWLVAADGSRRRRLKRRADPDDEPTRAAWSPSGDALAFVTRHGDEHGRLVMLGARCEWAHVLGPADGLRRPTFSSDGRFLTEGRERVDLVTGQRSTRVGCDQGISSADGKRCLVLDGAEGGAMTVSEVGTARTLEIARPKRGNWTAAEQQDLAWTRDGTTIFLVSRFRGVEQAVVGGETSLVRYDWSPLYRVQLPKVLPAKAGKPLVPELFAPGDTSVRAASFALSPTETDALWLEEHVPSAAHGTHLADATWFHLNTRKGTLLGERHKLIGLDSWVNDARWSPDGKTALLTLQLCEAGRAVDQFEPCARSAFELLVADEKRVGFVARGRLADWTAFDSLSP